MSKLILTFAAFEWAEPLTVCATGRNSVPAVSPDMGIIAAVEIV